MNTLSNWLDVTRLPQIKKEYGYWIERPTVLNNTPYFISSSAFPRPIDFVQTHVVGRLGEFTRRNPIDELYQRSRNVHVHALYVTVNALEIMRYKPQLVEDQKQNGPYPLPEVFQCWFQNQIVQNRDYRVRHLKSDTERHLYCKVMSTIICIFKFPLRREET